MESPFKILGHPVHPMLIVFPLGLLSVAVIFDIVYLATDNQLFAEIAFWNILAGLIGGGLAAIFGLVDWSSLPNRTRAWRIGLIHGGGNFVVMLLFAVSWFVRLDNVAYQPDLLPFILAVAGAGLALLTAWLGGELVYRLRVGVDEDAHLDASNSLRREGVVSTGRDGDAADAA